MAFLAMDWSDQQGIYAEIGGVLDVIIDNNDILDGKAIYRFEIGRHSFDNRKISFLASFTDGSQGIFIGRPVWQLSLSSIVATHSVQLRKGSTVNSGNIVVKGDLEDCSSLPPLLASDSEVSIGKNVYLEDEVLVYGNPQDP